MSHDDSAPSEDYLWDGRAPVDPFIERLEAVARSQAFDPSKHAWSPTAPKRRPWRVVAVVGGLTTMAAAVLLGWLVFPGGPSSEDCRHAFRLDGSAQKCRALAPDDWLEVSGRDAVSLDVGELGVITAAPGSRLRVREASSQLRHLELERGRVEAVVTAPPRLFQVSTPAGVAVDLGCAYSLDVDAEGRTVLSVTAGEVIFDGAEQPVVVPAGMQTEVRPGQAPTVPLRTDAETELVALVRALDEGETPAPDLLTAGLARAAGGDEVSLWYLRDRSQGEARQAVTRRLLEMAPPPSDVARSRLLRAQPDPAAEARWRDSLGLSVEAGDPGHDG